MRSLTKILLPVDFSERSLGAARYARCLSAKCSAEIILAHVLAPLQFQLGVAEMGGVMLSDLYHEQVEQLTGELERFRSSQLAGLPVRPILLEGDPATRIVEFAHCEAAGLIVMPTHGYGPFRRFILGSNTAKVLHDADCPVWTGVHLSDAPADVFPALGHILCAVDLGPQSAKALEWACEIGQSFGARMTLMHVTAGLPASGDREADAWRARVRWSAEKELERLEGAAHSNADLLVETGEPARAICAAAQRLQAGVLVIGRGSAAGVFGRLRTNAYAIIRQSPCPVVSV